MQASEFQRDFREFENAERLAEIKLLEVKRHANAQSARRIGRYVAGYDAIGYFPHLHAPHDEQVEPMRMAKAAGLVFGAIFAALITDQFIENPTWWAQVLTLTGFLTASRVAESAYCAWQPIPERFKTGSRIVWKLAFAAAVPIGTWLLMRFPNTPISGLAEKWEGFALVGAEFLLLLFAAAAGAAGRAYGWSREHFEKEVTFRDRLVELGAEVAAVPAPADGVTEGRA